MSSAFVPPGVTSGSLNWPKVPHDVQFDEEWIVYDAKAAFALALPAATAQQLSAFQAAVDKENDADLAFINAVNAGLAAGKSEFTGAIADIDAAAAALAAFFSNNNVDVTSGPAASYISDAKNRHSDMAGK